MALRNIRSEIPVVGNDYSDPLVDTLVVVSPFEVDSETGDILNKTKDPIFKQGQKVNVSEIAQSFYCDSFKETIRRIKEGQHEEIPQNKNLGEYMDLYSLPRNINELKDAMVANQKKIDELKSKQEKALAQLEEKKKQQAAADDQKLKDIVAAVLAEKGVK